MYNPYNPYGGGSSINPYGQRPPQQLPYGYEFNNVRPVPIPPSSFGGHPDGRKQGNIAFMGAGETLSDPRTSTKYEKRRAQHPTQMEKIRHKAAMDYSRIQDRAEETYTKIIPHPRQNNGDPRVNAWMSGNYGSHFSGPQSGHNSRTPVGGGLGSTQKSRKRRSKNKPLKKKR